MPIGAWCSRPASVSREIANAVVASGLWASWTSTLSGETWSGSSPTSTIFTPPVAESRIRPRDPSVPKRIGSPWTSGMIASSRVTGDLTASNAPSLKMGQFW